MKTKVYQKPTMKVVKLQQRTHLLQASGEVPQSKGASIDNYEDGSFSW
jgi:hypothetical protein